MIKIFFFIGLILLSVFLIGCTEVTNTEDFELRGMINTYKIGETELLQPGRCFSEKELIGIEIKLKQDSYHPFYFSKQTESFKEFIGKKAVIKGKIITTTYPCELFENCGGLSCQFAEIEEIKLLKNPICDLPAGGSIVDKMILCDLNGELIYSPSFVEIIMDQGQIYYYPTGEMFSCGGLQVPGTQDLRCSNVVCSEEEIDCE